MWCGVLCISTDDYINKTAKSFQLEKQNQSKNSQIFNKYHNIYEETVPNQNDYK